MDQSTTLLTPDCNLTPAAPRTQPFFGQTLTGLLALFSAPDELAAESQLARAAICRLIEAEQHRTLLRALPPR